LRPSRAAGLEAGDIITCCDGAALAGQDGRPHDVLFRMLVTKDEGDSVTVDYIRGGETRSATVVLEGLDVDTLILHGPAVWRAHEGLKLPVTPDAPEMAWFVPAGRLDMELVSLKRARYGG
jgi:hypothetical protein